MGKETLNDAVIKEAASFIARHGNVSIYPQVLIDTVPSPRQLAAAKEKCHRYVEQMFEVMEQHHNVKSEGWGN